MRLTFVHGMGQQNKEPEKLAETWQRALHKAWKSAGLSTGKYTLSMPYYGDVLHQLSEEVRSGTPVVARGELYPNPFTQLEELIIREIGAKAGISDETVRSEIGQEVLARGLLNWQWTQGIARALERRAPTIGKLSLTFVRQVDAYLTRRHITDAVDELVRPCLLGEPTVVVAHSLGTIVTYRLLQAASGTAEIPLFVTLGSPLGIDVVKTYLVPPRPLSRPGGVRRWLNGADVRDYIALIPRLDRRTFAAEIENVSDISNSQKDAHSIVDYLSDTTIASQIHAALSGIDMLSKRQANEKKSVKKIPKKKKAKKKKPRNAPRKT